MPIERTNIPSSRRTLTPRIVAPPKVGKDGVPLTHRPHSARATIVGSSFPAPPVSMQPAATTSSAKSKGARLRAAPHPQRISVDHEGHRVQEPAKKTKAVPDFIQSRVHDEQEYLKKREQIATQGREENPDDEKMDAERMLGVECSVDNADGWAGQMMARFLERFGRMVRQLDAQEDPILRADSTVQILHDLGDAMKSYRGIFHALAAEVRLIVTKYESRTQELSELRQDVERRDHAQQEELLTVEHAGKVKLRKLEAYIEERKGDQTRLHDEIFRARQERNEAAKERKSLARQEAENLSSRRQNEAMASQFAIKNRELEEKIPVLERDLTQTKSKADQLQQINSRYARRISQLEHETSIAMKQNKDSMISIQAALERTQSENKELHVQLQALKVLKHRIDKELKTAQESAEKDTASHETELRALTPRPLFRPQHINFFGSLTSSANRVDSLGDKVDILTGDLEEACQTNRTLASALSISKGATDSYKSLPVRSPFSEVGAVTQVNVAHGGVVPQFLVTSDEKVRCRAMQLRDAVYKMRELFDLHTSVASRTNKSVCLNMVVLSHYTDSVKAAQLKSGGPNKPNVPISVKGNDVGGVFDFVAPLTATESCYSLIYAAQFWSSHPVVGLFGCVLREEIGPWVWHEENKFVTQVMGKLASMGECELQHHLETLETELRDAGFSTPFILAAQHQLQLIYGVHQQKLFGGSHSLAASSSFRNRSGSMRGLVINEHSSVRIEFDAAKNNPASATAIVELPMVSVLRGLYLDRQNYFNIEYDRVLSTKATTINGRKVVSHGVAVSSLLRVCALDHGTADDFVSGVFSACMLQSRSEASFIRNPPDMVPGTSSASNLFMAGFTASYFGTLRQYPQLKPHQAAFAAAGSAHLLPTAPVVGKSPQRKNLKTHGSKDATPAMTPLQMALTPTIAGIQLGRGSMQQLGSAPAAFSLEGDGGVTRFSLDGPLGEAMGIVEEIPGSRAPSNANSPHTPSLPLPNLGGERTPPTQLSVTSSRRGTTAGTVTADTRAPKPSGPLVPLVLFQRMFRKLHLTPTYFTLENFGSVSTRRRSGDSTHASGDAEVPTIPTIELS